MGSPAGALAKAGLCGSVGRSLSLVVVDLTPAFWFRAEVKKKANLELSRLQVIEQLSLVHKQSRAIVTESV